MRFSKSLRNHRLFGIGAAALLLLLLHTSGLRGQEATPEATPAPDMVALTPPTSADHFCADVRTLMQLNTTPSERLTGGSTVRPGVSVQGEISSGDFGDVWSFVVQNATSNTTVEITLSDSSLPLEFSLYRGLNRLHSGAAYQPMTPGETVTLPSTRNGIYTLAVRAADFAAANALTEATRYTMRVDYQGTDEVAATLPNLRDETTREDFIQGRDFAFEAGRQVITFASGAAFSVNAGSVQSVATRENAAGQLIFSEGGGLLLDSWAQQVSLVGGDLSVVGTVNDVPRVFYLENYGARVDLVSSLQSALEELTDSNGTRFATDWQGITGIWMLADCVGVRFDDATTLVVPLTGATAERRLSISGGGSSALDCPELALAVTARTADGTLAAHSGCIVREAIQPGSEISWQDSVFAAQLLEDRRLILETRGFVMRPLEAPFAGGESAPVRVEVTTLDERTVSLAFDWEQLAQFSLLGDQVRFDFLDAMRSTMLRDGANLRQVEAIGDVIRLVDQGQNAPERLVFGAAEGYLELITPAGGPTFDGQPFNARALPGEAGFSATALNNTGGECYPVNTLLAQANCPPAGEVNPANGNWWYRVVDQRAAHPLGDLTLSRSYNSALASVDGPFGYGWTTEYLLDYNIPFDPVLNSRPVDGANPERPLTYRVGLDLTWTPRGLVTVTTSSGSRHLFVRQGIENGREVYTAVTMPTWRLSREGTNATAIVRSEWLLEQPNGLTYRYDRAGRLLEYGFFERGHRVTIAYPSTSMFDGPGGIGEANAVIITDDAAQRQIELYYNADHRIARSILRDLTVTASDGSCAAGQNCFEIRYTYQDGRLIEAAYPGGQTAVYRYDAVGRLIAYDDPRAPLLARMAVRYTGETGGAVSEVYALRAEDALPEEIAAEVPYLLVQRLEVEQTRSERRVTVTDFYGAVRVYTYRLTDENLLEARDANTLVSVSSPLAETDSFEAVPTQFTWEDGLLVGQPFRALPQFAGRGRNAIEYGYDAQGNLTEVRGGLPGFAAVMPEDAPEGAFQPLSVTFADQTSVTYQYDTDGNVSAVTDRAGAVYEITRRANGLPAQVRRANDGVLLDYQYVEDRSPGFVAEVVERISEADAGYRVAYTYDGLGQITSVDDSLLGVYTLTYAPLAPQSDGSFRRTISVTAPDGSVTRYTYDGRDRLVEVLLLPNAEETAYLRRTTYNYDPADALERLSAVTQWLRDAATGEETPVSITYTVTPQPELTEAGDRIYIGGWQLTETGPGGQSHSMVYDALGRVRLFSEGARTHRYDYDVREVSNPAPNPTENVNGLRIIESEIFGGALVAETDYLFDFAGQLTGVRRQQGNPLTADAPAWVAEWRLIPATLSAVNTQLRLLQAPLLGLPTIEWADYTGNAAGSVEIGRAIPGEVIARVNDQAVEVDFLGRPLSVSTTVGGTVETFNLAYCPRSEGRRAVHRAAAGEEATCDSGASVTSDAHGRTLEIQDETGVRTFEYRTDAERGGTSVTVVGTGSDGSAFTWALFYDAAGNLQSWTDETGVSHEYTYDTLGRLRRVSVDGMPEASYRFNYTLSGQLTEQIDDLGRGSRYLYNEQGRLIVEQDASTSDASSFFYDLAGRLTGIVSPLGGVTTVQYTDPVDPERVTAIISPMGRDEFVWDDTDRSITHIDGTGSATAYAFDGLGQMTGIFSPLQRTQTLTYDQAGRLTGWETAEGSAQEAVQLGYNALNGTVDVTTPVGSEWRFTFDPSAALIGVRAPDGQSAQWARDVLGRPAVLTLATDSGEESLVLERANGAPALNVIAPDGANALRYDALYRLVQSGEGDAQTAITYQPVESEGLVNVRVQTPLETRVFSFHAGNDRQPPRVTVRSTGRRVTYTYDAEGRLTLIAQETCISGDPFDPLAVDLTALRVEEPGACVGEDGELWQTNTRILYEARGLPTRRIDAEDAVETFTYDALGRLVAYQDGDGRSTTYTYDALNRLIRLSSPGGQELHFAYALDQVVGVCQSPIAAAPDYAACAAAGGVLVRAPVAGSDGEDAANAAREDSALVTERDPLGRVSALRAGERQLTFTYDDDGRGYQVRDDQTGAVLTIRLTAALLPESIGYQAGAAGEATPVLEVAYFAQETNGVLPFSLLWGSGDLLDFRVDRRGDALFVDLIGQNAALTVDYTGSPRGAVRRYVLSGDHVGYTVILGDDQAGNPLTMRVTDTATGLLLYQSSFLYDAFGRLEQETRDYADGASLDARYRYDALDRTRLAGQVIQASAADGSAAWARELTYTYDERGNLTTIVAGDETCATYNYDGAGRLIAANTGDRTTRYTYDAAGRVASANEARFLYDGDQQLPFAVMTPEDTVFLPGLPGELSTGAPLFMADSRGVTPFLTGGRGQLFGLQGEGEAPLWLFDPLRRLITLTSPAAPESPCAPLTDPSALPAYLPLFEEALWDTQADLVFVGSRAYLPLIGRFLQPNPNGVDATGRRYEWVQAPVNPPVQIPEGGELRGLEALLSFEARRSASAGLTAEAVAAEMMPAPAGGFTSAWASALTGQRQAFQTTVEGLLAFPAWLTSAYNLPGASLDLTDGALRVAGAPAPGHSGFGNGLPADTVASPSAALFQLDAPGVILTRLIDRQTMPAAAPTLYQPFGWRDEGEANFALPVLPSVRLENTPSAVLERLPRALTSVPPTGVSVLPLLTELEQLDSATLSSWIDQILEDALPGLPVLPSEDADVWAAAGLFDFEDALRLPDGDGG